VRGVVSKSQPRCVTHPSTSPDVERRSGRRLKGTASGNPLKRRTGTNDPRAQAARGLTSGVAHCSVSDIRLAASSPKGPARLRCSSGHRSPPFTRGGLCFALPPTPGTAKRRRTPDLTSAACVPTWPRLDPFAPRQRIRWRLDATQHTRSSRSFSSTSSRGRSISGAYTAPTECAAAGEDGLCLSAAMTTDARHRMDADLSHQEGTR
jgi:hypothetical protein